MTLNDDRGGAALKARRALRFRFLHFVAPKPGPLFGRHALGCRLIKAKRQSDGRQGRARQEGAAGPFIGMTGLGASGPVEKLYEHFNIATKAVVNAAWKQLLSHARTIASAECRN